MAKIIAISGKGGTGKTTIAAMIVRHLAGKGKSILAVDADPNSCLGLVLGVGSQLTIAQLREQAKTSSGQTDKVRTFEYGISQAITESKGFDLLTMGRPEGPGCYCAVNNLLRNFLDKLSSAYDYVVTDNEAGMEHLSRRTTNNVDLLLIVAEATALGEVTAKRIFALAKELPISVKQMGIVWNRAESIKQLEGIEVFGCVPYDEAVFEASMQGETIFGIEQDNPALSAVQEMFEEKFEKLKAKSS